MLPLVSFLCPDVCGLAPPTCAAGGTWLGCRWRGLGDDDPPMVLWSSMRLAIPTRISRSIFRALDTPRSSWCSSLSAPPPTPPFPVQPYLSQYPPYHRESIFVIAPLSLSPSVPPVPGPVDLLNAVRASFHVHPPYSVAMFGVRSHPNP